MPAFFIVQFFMDSEAVTLLKEIKAIQEEYLKNQVNAINQQKESIEIQRNYHNTYQKVQKKIAIFLTGMIVILLLLGILIGKTL